MGKKGWHQSIWLTPGAMVAQGWASDSIDGPRDSHPWRTLRQERKLEQTLAIVLPITTPRSCG